MKTAQQWTEETQNGLAVTSVGSQLETDLLLQMAKAIQMDAYKAGMSEAATIAENTISEESLWIHLKIRKARDAKATL